uniref:SJCHGC08853 protein n=1 Tax=Schistosoma japonicum TaxID=6182 RepID=Q5DFC9_SCHJA|nr:SJCHGC08853 protein [Schistosoma japonicum]
MIMLIGLIILTFKIPHGLSAKEQYLQFIPVNGVSHGTYFYEHPGLRNPIEVDATVQQQVRIRIVEHLNELPVLRIHCIVAPLDSTHELVSAYLCRRKSVHDSDECIDPKTRNVVFGRVEFSAIGNRSSGYTFSSRLPVRDELLDGFYSCKFHNQNGELISNFIEIQDAYYYHKRMVRRPVKQTEFLPLCPSIIFL